MPRHNVIAGRLQLATIAALCFGFGSDQRVMRTAHVTTGAGHAILLNGHVKPRMSVAQWRPRYGRTGAARVSVITNLGPDTRNMPRFQALFARRVQNTGVFLMRKAWNAQSSAPIELVTQRGQPGKGLDGIVIKRRLAFRGGADHALGVQRHASGTGKLW